MLSADWRTSVKISGLSPGLAQIILVPLIWVNRYTSSLTKDLAFTNMWNDLWFHSIHDWLSIHFNWIKVQCLSVRLQWIWDFSCTLLPPFNCLYSEIQARNFSVFSLLLPFRFLASAVVASPLQKDKNQMEFPIGQKLSLVLDGVGFWAATEEQNVPLDAFLKVALTNLSIVLVQHLKSNKWMWRNLTWSPFGW